ncbi:MAG: NrfD/PsrC family molybdoenzyme membrane anchor subunit [Variovorax sp.]
MPDTFFTATPDWGWLIVGYLFIGGLVGGCFFLAAMLHLGGGPTDRPTVHAGYVLAVLGAMICGILLVVDLSQPLRFWHMLVQSNTGWPMFKAWSPMSVGSWGFAAFSLFATVAAVGAWAEARHPGSLLSSVARSWPGAVIAAVGGALGLFVAGYTGVMFSVTNRPLWGDSALLGGLFLSSAAATAAALLTIIASWHGGGQRATAQWLQRIGAAALVVELLFLIAFVVSLGAAAQGLAGVWGWALGAVLVGGVLVPLVMQSSKQATYGSPRFFVAAALVLVGGFLLRTVIVFSSSAIHVSGSGVHGL